MKKIRALKPPMIVISGSCLKFAKEREKIMEFIGELEWGAHAKSNCECSSNGSALGWDFFQIYFDPEFVEHSFLIRDYVTHLKHHLQQALTNNR